MGFAEGMQALSAPATKLIESVSHAIGKAYEPRHIRKLADAKAYEINRISEAIRSNSDLPIVYNGSATEINITDYDGLRKRAGYRLAYQEVQKQENIEAVIDQAFIELDGKQLETDEPISPEWMSRFINSAGEISTEELQKIWAKVLVGEVIQPNSYSMKTLECLRNLSIKDAKLFSKIANYAISDSMIFADTEINQKYDILYRDILTLDDDGLINSSGMIVAKHVLHEQEQLILDFGEYALVASSTERKTINIPQYPLTRAGIELLPIARQKTLDYSYISDVVSYLKNKNNNTEWTLHKIKSRNGNKITI